MHFSRFPRHLTRLFAATLFAAGTSTAVVVGSATHAGQPNQALFSSAPQAAAAAVSIGIGIELGGPNRYYRYANRGGTWIRFGFGYAPAPGYVQGYYLGYAPPPRYYPRPYYFPRPYYGPRYRPAYYGGPYGYHPRYGYYPRYRHAYYGRGYDGHGYSGRGYYGR